MSEEQKAPQRIVWTVRVLDAVGFGGGAVLLTVLADQLDFLAMPKFLFWTLYCVGIILVSFAVVTLPLIEWELRKIERKFRKHL